MRVEPINQQLVEILNEVWILKTWPELKRKRLQRRVRFHAKRATHLVFFLAVKS